MFVESGQVIRRRKAFERCLPNRRDTSSHERQIDYRLVRRSKLRCAIKHATAYPRRDPKRFRPKLPRRRLLRVAEKFRIALFVRCQSGDLNFSSRFPVKIYFLPQNFDVYVRLPKVEELLSICALETCLRVNRGCGMIKVGRLL